MSEDLFEGISDHVTTTKKRPCLVCGAEAPRPGILCLPCRSAAGASMARLQDEVTACESSWRAQLATCSPATQERFVGIVRAHGEAYAGGENRSRGKRIATFKARLSATVRTGGELGTVAGMYARWLTRSADLQLVAVVALMGGTIEGEA